MAATTFKNVHTVVVGGVSITGPLSLDLEYEGDLKEDKNDGDVFISAHATGAQTRRMRVTARDPITIFSARGASGACSFKLKRGGDESTVRSFAVGTGTAGNPSFESGEPGELGTASIEVVLQGSTYTPS